MEHGVFHSLPTFSVEVGNLSGQLMVSTMFQKFELIYNFQHLDSGWLLVVAAFWNSQSLCLPRQQLMETIYVVFGTLLVK